MTNRPLADKAFFVGTIIGVGVLMVIAGFVWSLVVWTQPINARGYAEWKYAQAASGQVVLSTSLFVIAVVFIVLQACCWKDRVRELVPE